FLLHCSLMPCVYLLSLLDALPIWVLALIPGPPLLGAAVIAAARRRWGKPALAGTAAFMVALAFAATVVALIRYLGLEEHEVLTLDRKSTRLNSSHVKISYAVFCLK